MGVYERGLAGCSWATLCSVHRRRRFRATVASARGVSGQRRSGCVGMRGRFSAAVRAAAPLGLAHTPRTRVFVSEFPRRNLYRVLSPCRGRAFALGAAAVDPVLLVCDPDRDVAWHSVVQARACGALSDRCHRGHLPGIGARVSGCRFRAPDGRAAGGRARACTVEYEPREISLR